MYKGKYYVEGPSFDVIAVYSGLRNNFDPYYELSVFKLDKNKRVCKDVDQLMSLTMANIVPTNFRNRKIALANNLKYTRPHVKDFNGIIVDLSVSRSAESNIIDEFGCMNGLAVVAWAVQHTIPVGLVYRDNIENKSKNFYIEQILDTLESHPNCVQGTIPSGNLNTVCFEMRKVLLKLLPVT